MKQKLIGILGKDILEVSVTKTTGREGTTIAPLMTSGLLYAVSMKTIYLKQLKKIQKAIR